MRQVGLERLGGQTYTTIGRRGRGRRDAASARGASLGWRGGARCCDGELWPWRDLGIIKVRE